MRGKGISIGHSVARTCSDRKTLKRCTNNANQDNIVIIDVDSGNVSNFIAIDIPESLPRRLRGSDMVRKDNKIPLATVICIDDDENSVNHPGIGVTDDDDGFDSATSSSMRYCPSSNQHQNSLDAAGDGCRFVMENISPVKLSKCKRTYSGKDPTRNHYGLSIESESESSDSDYLDCEFMVDSHGKLQEEWEKASLKRKNGSRHGNGQSSVENLASASRLSTDTNQNTTSGWSSGNKDGPPFVSTADGNQGNTSQNSRPPFIDANLKSMPEAQFLHSCADFHHHEEPVMEDTLCSEKDTNIDLGHDDSDFQNKEPIPQCSSVFVNHDQGGDELANYGKTSLQDKGKGTWKNSEPFVSVNFCHRQANLVDEEVSLEKGLCPGAEDNHGMFASRQKEKKFQQASFCYHSKCLNEVRHGTHSFKEKENSCLMKSGKVFSESMCNIQQQDRKDDPLHSQAVDDMRVSKDSIIGEREKLKETDEYKRAVEEEWASRQQQLQIQAEEAQQLRRLRKKKRAESLRLLDMERRQKQRVEEMRQFQKKDEENLNLKETLRAEIRKDLNKLEVSCHDMASLLRGLGLHVGGGLQPLPNEVHAAYKRALISFHPDRASKSDIRQQVEAEEKFKLVSFMKEKYFLTSG